MSAEDNLPSEIGERLGLRDGAYVKRLMPLLRFAVKYYFRSDVRGVEKFPDGGALVVSNHSGGWVAMDVPVIAVAFHDHFGPDRPLYILAHDMLFMGQGKDIFPRAGIPACDPRERPRGADLRRRDDRLPGR